MAKYRIMSWKHIPQSITVEGDGRTIKKQLSQKIQDKIDAYAMAEGLTSTSEYAAQYKRGDWVRTAPSSSGTTSGTQLKSAMGRVVGGPWYSNLQWWWQIDFDSGADGWVAQGKLKKIVP